MISTEIQSKICTRGGARHLKSIKNIGFGIYDWLIKNNFPSGFQVLCCNCNYGKNSNHGICPHKGTR